MRVLCCIRVSLCVYSLLCVRVSLCVHASAPRLYSAEGTINDFTPPPCASGVAYYPQLHAGTSRETPGERGHMTQRTEQQAPPPWEDNRSPCPDWIKLRETRRETERGSERERKTE